MATPARTAADRLAALEGEVAALKRELRGRKRRSAKRAATIARRTRTAVLEVSDVDRARARAILRRLGR